MTTVEVARPDLQVGTVPRANPTVVLVLLLGAQFMLAVDFSILNVALPTVGSALHLSASALPWVATAFALPAAGFTILFGRIGDLYGRRRFFLGGLALLAASSFLGGLATGPTMLLTARALQGFAAAMATPSALSLLTTSFPEGPARQRALGLNGALLSGGFVAGALFGGVLTNVLGWRWAFLLNVPVAVVILLFAPRHIADSRSEARPRLDVPGAVTVTAGLLVLVYGVTRAGSHGWTSPVALALLGISAVLLAGFLLVERTAPEPLASPAVLRRRSVRWGNAGGLVTFSMQSAIVYLMTLYLQEVLGYSAMTTGLAFAAPGVTAIAVGVVAGRVIARVGVTRTLVVGLVVQALGNLPLLLVGTSKVYVLAPMLLLVVAFAGHISAIVAYTVTATSGLPDEEQGLATGLSTLTQQVAITIGIPILGAVMTARERGLGATHAHRDALLGGIRLAVAVDVGVTLVLALVIGFFLTRNTRRPVVLGS